MTATAHGASGHLPLPPEQRRGLALCFSGGGYRAALFHLGAMRRLDELGVLSRVDTFTSVSGGSIVAAQVASHAAEHPEAWAQPGERVAGFEREIAEPMRAFTQRNIRTRAVLTRLKPRNWFNPNAQIDALAERLAEGPARGKLTDLPERPRFVFCSTNALFRSQWTFDSGGSIGDELAGRTAPTDEWTIARAAAASSCLPGAFSDMRFANDPDVLSEGTYADDDRAALVQKIDLTDGGIYDNLGVEPVWHDHETILVSDAGPSFKPDPGLGHIWKALRYSITLLEQATEVRKRWLISGFVARQLRGAYWGIASKPGNYPYRPPVDVYSDAFVARFVAPIRIDLDVFSEAERAVLENHGYLMAEVALRSHASDLLRNGPPPEVPFPRWMSETDAADALRESWKTKLFARGWFR